MEHSYLSEHSNLTEPRQNQTLVETKDKNVLAGTEYSGTAAGEREEKSLVFGNEVPEDKFTSCKPRGNDPRSLIIQFQFHYNYVVSSWKISQTLVL